MLNTLQVKYGDRAHVAIGDGDGMTPLDILLAWGDMVTFAHDSITYRNKFDETFPLLVAEWDEILSEYPRGWQEFWWMLTDAENYSTSHLAVYYQKNWQVFNRMRKTLDVAVGRTEACKMLGLDELGLSVDQQADLMDMAVGYAPIARFRDWFRDNDILEGTASVIMYHVYRIRRSEG